MDGTINENKNLKNEDEPEKKHDTEVNHYKKSCTALPTELLENVFKHLSIKDLVAVSMCCKHFRDVSQSDYLWKRFVRRKFGVEENKDLLPGALSWRDEYKRLSYHLPTTKTQEFDFEPDLSGVCFSRNGKLFVTCCSSGLVQIWTSSHPSRELYRFNVHILGWIYARVGYLNANNTKLMLKEMNNAIAIFSLQKDTTTSQGHLSLDFTFNEYDYNDRDTWIGDNYFLSLTAIKGKNKSRSMIFELIDANSKQENILKFPIYEYKFNINSIIQNVLVVSLDEEDNEGTDVNTNNSSWYQNKMLIYVSTQFGSITHPAKIDSIEFKRFKNLEFFNTVDPKMSIEEILEYRKQNPTSKLSDTPDKIIEFNTDISNIMPCPKNRYLYVQSVTTPREREIKIQKIDLRSFEITSILLNYTILQKRDHHYFIHMDVNKHYISSWNGFICGTLYDRHYEVPLKNFYTPGEFHYIIMNPKNSEMLLTKVDGKIKIYRSQHAMKKIMS